LRTSAIDTYNDKMTGRIGSVSDGQSGAINKGRLLTQRQAEVTDLINGKGGTRTLDPGIMSSRLTLTSTESCAYNEARITGVFRPFTEV
jgi:hypothetical protein